MQPVGNAVRLPSRRRRPLDGGAQRVEAGAVIHVGAVIQEDGRGLGVETAGDRRRGHGVDEAERRIPGDLGDARRRGDRARPRLVVAERDVPLTVGDRRDAGDSRLIGVHRDAAGERDRRARRGEKGLHLEGVVGQRGRTAERQIGFGDVRRVVVGNGLLGEARRQVGPRRLTAGAEKQRQAFRGQRRTSPCPSTPGGLA